MVTEIQYTNIKTVLEDIMGHPLLSDVTLEQAVRYTMKFIAAHGYPKFYQDKIEIVPIKDFRGALPCDLIKIIQVKDLSSDLCLRSMTDTFTPGLSPKHHPQHKPIRNFEDRDFYIPKAKRLELEGAFKTQGRIIYTSFPEGEIEIAYKAIPVDDDGFPLLIENEIYLDALAAYIKKRVFTIKFDLGKVSPAILQKAEQDYAVLSKELEVEFTTPSVSEVESYTRMFNTLIPRVRQFDNSFRDLGNREYLRRH